MPTPAQAAAATVGAGSLAAAGAYGITQAVNGSGEEVEEQTTEESNEIPSEVTTFLATEAFTSEPYNTKLISLIKAANLPNLVKPENNEKWWDWAFKNKYSKLKKSKKEHTVFTSVTNPETLKTACQEAYKQNKTEYKFEDTEYLLKNISDYCTNTANSIDISEPKAQVYASAQANNYQNGVLSIGENASILVKKDAETTNDLWWKWAFKTLYKATEHDSDDNFKEITTGFDSGSETTPKSLNKQCDEAYKKPYSELTKEDNSLLKKIKKLCSTDRTETLLKLPEPVVVDGNLLTSTTSGYSGNKLVKANDKKLVDSTKETDWWNWVFENVFKPFKSSANSSLKNPFNATTITKGYEAISGDVTGDAPSLNKACNLAYKKQKTELLEKTTGDNTLLKLVEKFCVPSSKGTLSEPSEQ